MTVTLTKRQREVVALVCEGLTYAEISRRLGISSATVRVHVADVADKIQGTGKPYRRVFRWACTRLRE